jgi:C1A family cysteine protease
VVAHIYRETMKVQRMAEGVVLAALLAAAMAVVVAKGVPLMDKDLESEASMWSLYERWRSVHTVSLDLEEKERRFETFKENARYINEFNKRKDVPYKLGLNQFSDLTLEEFTSMYTGLASAVTSSDEQPLVTAGDVPDVWDWREQGAVTAVKDQGNCGTCVVLFVLCMYVFARRFKDTSTNKHI